MEREEEIEKGEKARVRGNVEQEEEQRSRIVLVLGVSDKR